MASTSLSRSSWDPYTVLDVNPKDPNCTCVGFGTYKQKRCGFPLHRIEQFHPSQRITAINCLDSMSKMHPSKIDSAALMVLAENTLCREWHKYQAFQKSNEWKARIELYLHEHSQKQAVVVVEPVRQLQYEVRDTKRLQNGGTAKDSDTSAQEIKATRLALEKVKADLKESETRCSGLIEKNSRLDEDHAAHSQDIASLKQQLTDSQKWARALALKADEAERLRKRLADEKVEEVDKLKKQMARRNANFTKDVAAKSTEISGLKARVRELEGLNQSYIESRSEDAVQVSRLREQDRKVELLTKQMEAVGRELEVREVCGTLLELLERGENCEGSFS